MAYAVPAPMRSTFSKITKDPHVPLGQVMMQNAAIVRHLGLTNPLSQRLGTGAFGAAYQTPLCGGSVLKFTRDPTEAQAAAVLIGKETHRVVRVYGMWAFPETFSAKLRGWYLVHRCFLNPLSKLDLNLVEMLFALRYDRQLDLKLPSRHHHSMRDKWRGYIRAELEEGAVTDDEGAVHTFSGKDLQRALALLEEITLAVREMSSYGIDWEDFHSGNMMRGAQGQLVIGDIGWGMLQERTKMTIPLLTEDVARAYAEQRG